MFSVIYNLTLDDGIAILCTVGCIQSAEGPFSSLLSSEQPSLEEMRQVVCSKQLRPHPVEHWNQDEVRTPNKENIYNAAMDLIERTTAKNWTVHSNLVSCGPFTNFRTRGCLFFMNVSMSCCYSRE